MQRRKKNKRTEQDFFLGNMLSDETGISPEPTAPKPKSPHVSIKPKQKHEKVQEEPLVLPEKPKEDLHDPEETRALLDALSQNPEPPREEPWAHVSRPEAETEKAKEKDDMWNEDLWKKDEAPSTDHPFLAKLKEQAKKKVPATKEKAEKALSAAKVTAKNAVPLLKKTTSLLWKNTKRLGRKLAAEGKRGLLFLIQSIKEGKNELLRRFRLSLEKKAAEKEAAKKAAEEAAEREAIKKAENEFRKKYGAVKTRLLTKRDAPEGQTEKNGKAEHNLPKENESVDLNGEDLSAYLSRSEKKGKAEKKEASSKKSARPHARRDITKAPLTGADAVKASLDGMYGVYRNPKKQKKKKLRPIDYVRYAFLFVCIFGFFSAGFFVFQKLYDYYRAHVIYSGLQEMVSQKDHFADEYLKKASISIDTLTPEEILAGKKPEGEEGAASFTEEQETLVNKIAKLKKINPDTAGWISIDGTVVDYPLVWSAKRNYYLHRDFYGKTLSGGAIFIDERNDPDITKNRNTVIYGHNMADGSMFASIHDYAGASVFYGTKIEIATQNGIYVYTPFSVHHSNAFDNYFETDFVSDEDFIDFCEQMAFLSLHETDVTFNKNSQIITLSTCMDNETATEERFAVHAVLTQVIR